MLIWVLVTVLFVLFAAVGYAKGAIRMMIPLVGLFLGAGLALPLAPLLKPYVPKVGLENPIWSILLPPVVVFLVINLIFVGLGFFGHAKVSLLHKYRSDDVQHLMWQRLNQRLGMCVGLVAGAIYSVLISLVVYIVGYLTVQVSPGEGESSSAKYLNDTKAALQASGMDRIAAALDSTPEWYYQASDILGLLYHNPALNSRLAAYPPMISLAERPEFAEIAGDTEFQNLLAGQPSVADVVNHPRIQTVVGNADSLAQLRTLDLKDLSQYLRTGVSERYQDTPILGRWEVDPYLTFLGEKRRRKEMTATDVRLLRFQMEYVRGLKLLLAPDNTVRLKGPDIGQVIGRLADLAKLVSEGSKPRPQVIAVAPQTLQPSQPVTSQDPNARVAQQQLAQRYGIRNPTAPTPTPSGPGPSPLVATAPAAQPAPQMITTAELAAEIARLPMTTLAEGTWREENGRYYLTFQPARELPQFIGTRRSTSVEANFRDDRLYLAERNQGLVMSRF
jgi:uncharacterized membrane protein required for colicin V production